MYLGIQIEACRFHEPVVGPTVNDFLQQDVPVWVFVKIGEGDNTVKVAHMTVQVSGDDQSALMGQVNHVAFA